MELRRLKALLSAINAGPLATYEDLPDGGVKLSFAVMEPHVAAPAVADADDDLELPSGIIDPRKKLREIYAKQQRKRSA